MSEPTREQFARQVIDSVRKRFPLAKVSKGAEPFSVRINGRVASLESLYRLTLLRPEQIDHQVERWAVEMIRAAEGTPDGDADFETVADRILPIVVGAGTENAHPALAQTPLVPGLSVSYVIDGDRTIAHILYGQLTRWGVDVETLHERAIVNLIERSQTLAAEAAQDPNGQTNLVLFQTGDGYDSSRILLPNLHTHLRQFLGSPFLAAVPNRDILICFRNNAETIDGLKNQIKHDYATMPHQVTEQLFLVTADGLATWKP